MGKTTEDIKISLNASLKGSPKGVFPTIKFEIIFFILKFAKKKHYFLPKKLKNYIFASKVMSGLPNVKNSLRKPYLLSRNAHFAIGILYRLFVVCGELSRHFYHLKGLVSFSGHIYVSFTRMKVELAWLCVWQSICFH